MTDFSTLSKKELIALLESQKAGQAPAQEAPASPQASVDVTALMQAIVASQAAQRASDEPEKTYKLVNAQDMSVGLNIPDMRGGSKHVFLERKGNFIMLTADQIKELQDSHRVLFESGALAVPGLMELNANTILDFDKFIEELAVDDIESRIGAITSEATLWALFHHIESKRFQTHDENGQPFTEGTDRDKTFVVREVRLPQKAAAIETEVKRCLESRTFVKLSLDGK